MEGPKGKSQPRSVWVRLGVTTDDHGHLLGFSEYAAMYLLVWNPFLCWKLNVDRNKNKNLKDFTLAVDAARRVMAHLPTYMLFDDHEITDDWYFNRAWKTANLKEPFTRAIIANGLAAYWAFQGWGNAPEAFSEDFSKAIANHLTKIAKTGRLDSDLLKEYQQQLCASRDWSFFTPTKPPALFIDTRTLREMSGGETAVLIGDDGQKQILRKARAAGIRTSPDVLLLVLPGPLMGWNPAVIGQKVGRLWATEPEELLSPVVAAIKRRFGVTWEMLKREWEEFWNNPDGVVNVIVAVSKLAPRACVVFSGDVHFSYCVDAKCFWMPGTAIGISRSLGRFIQITSSPIKNFNDNFAESNSLGNIGEKHLSKTYRKEWPRDRGVYIITGEALPLRTGNREERTSLPDNNFCLVTFKGMEIWAHFLALSEGIGATLHSSRWFRL